MTDNTEPTTAQPPNPEDLVSERLLAGETPRAIADDLGLSCYGYQGDDSEDVVVLPCWHADDGNAEIEMDSSVASGREAAQEYVDGGDWGGEGESTFWVDVYVWRVGLRCVDGEIIEERVDKSCYTIAVDPPEPECVEGHEHEWRSPISLVGGIKENPGVWGHGGGVLIHEVCRHCGRHRHSDTWAQDMSDGTQGLDSVRYEPADDDSLTWVARKDAKMLGEALAEFGDVETIDSTSHDLTLSPQYAVDDDEYVPNETLAKIDAALPSGWTADHCAKGDRICIERDA